MYDDPQLIRRDIEDITPQDIQELSGKLQKSFNQSVGEGLALRPSNNPAFNKVIQELIDLHDKKNHDYSPEGKPFENFEIAAKFAGINTEDQIRSLLGTKFARMVNLVLHRADDPNFESLEDTEFDFVVYWIINRAYRRS